MKYKKLIEDITQAPSVRVKKYLFKKYSFGEEGSYLSPELLQEVTLGLHELCSNWNPEYYTVFEPGGLPYGGTIANTYKKGLRIVRTKKDSLETPNELLKQRTSYCERSLFMEGFKKGDKTVIVEDVISTGGTLTAILDHLLKIGVEVEGIACICRKGNDDLDKFGIPINSLVYLPEITR